MQQMIELHPRADALDVLGLPAIPYPVALPAFKAAVANDGELPLADMLRGLQLRAADGAGWRRLEPAMARLSELLAPDGAHAAVDCGGEGWSLEIAQAAADRGSLRLCRDGSLLATISDRGDGRLRLAAFRPLDARSIGLLLGLAATGGPGDGHGCWQRALEAAAGPAQREAAAQGLAHLVPPGEAGADAEGPGPRRPACVAAEIGTWRAPQG